MRFLLSNDDSHQSPLLQFVIDFLSDLGELVVVVPKHEQSWKGKSMSRFNNIHIEEIELGGKHAYSVDGTPADCINIGIHHICKGARPDLIVSGINAGLNAGVGFVLSSGTVGACLEANIAGLPAIALSQMFDPETMSNYTAEYALPEKVISRLKVQSERLLERLFAVVKSNTQFFSKPITWNVNFPFIDSQKTKFRLVSLGHTFYGSCYRAEHDYFVHDLSDVQRDKRDETDIQTLLEGHVSVTPIDICSFGQLEANLPGIDAGESDAGESDGCMDVELIRKAFLQA